MIEYGSSLKPSGNNLYSMISSEISLFDSKTRKEFVQIMAERINKKLRVNRHDQRVSRNLSKFITGRDNIISWFEIWFLPGLSGNDVVIESSDQSFIDLDCTYPPSFSDQKKTSTVGIFLLLLIA